MIQEVANQNYSSETNEKMMNLVYDDEDEIMRDLEMEWSDLRHLTDITRKAMNVHITGVYSSATMKNNRELTQ